MAGEDGGELWTTPLGMAGPVLQRVLVDETIEVVRQRTRHFRWSTGAGAISAALHPLGGKAMDPFAQRGIRERQRVGDGLEALPADDIPDGLGAPEDTGLRGLLQEGCSGRAGGIRKVEFEGPHGGGLQEKVRQQFTVIHGPVLL